MGALSIYLDASVIIPFFLPDVFVARAKAFLFTEPSGLVISDFASAEFASAVGRRLRMKQLSFGEAQMALANFDIWIDRAASRTDTTSADVRSANTILRRLNLVLRTPDALHIAITQRIGAELATFDSRMAENARALGVALAPV
jgi:predicted nucleic acid-binding protein